jgi:repressor LexA
MFAKRLRQLRKGRKLTQTELAGALHVTQQAVGKWENGRSFPDSGALIRLGRYFEVSLDFLLGQESFPAGSRLYTAVGQAAVPIIGTVRAGFGALAFMEEQGSALAEVRDPENYFYLLVRGDSMEPRIQDGDLALVRRQPTLEDGDLGVVVYGDGEGTIKRFRRKGGAVVLQPFNPAYEPLILAGMELEQLYIAGRVVETKARW